MAILTFVIGLGVGVMTASFWTKLITDIKAKWFTPKA